MLHKNAAPKKSFIRQHEKNKTKRIKKFLICFRQNKYFIRIVFKNILTIICRSEEKKKLYLYTFRIAFYFCFSKTLTTFWTMSLRFSLIFRTAFMTSICFVSFNSSMRLLIAINVPVRPDPALKTVLCLLYCQMWRRLLFSLNLNISLCVVTYSLERFAVAILFKLK